VNAMQLAALIAAGFFAVGVCAAVYVLVRLGRLISVAGVMLSDYRDRTDALIDRAQAAVDRSHEQLARTDEITASMDQVAAGMAELTGRVTALAPLARLAAATSGTKLARVSAFVYGVRHAAELRATASEARRAAGVSSPSQLSRGPGAPGVVPRGGGAGGRPPGPAQPAGDPSGVRS